MPRPLHPRWLQGRRGGFCPAVARIIPKAQCSLRVVVGHTTRRL